MEDVSSASRRITAILPLPDGTTEEQAAQYAAALLRDPVIREDHPPHATIGRLANVTVVEAGLMLDLDLTEDAADQLILELIGAARPHWMAFLT